MEEIEAKFLDIDSDAIAEALGRIGAEFKGHRLFRSISFDFPGFPMDKESAWVRLRDEGDKVTLAHKQRLGASDTVGKDAGMSEVEFVASDFDTARAFLHKLGLVTKFEQEKKRSSWVKGSVHYDIDTWPRLEPYLEIEATSWDELHEAARELGLDPEKKMVCSATQIYELAGIRDKDYIVMTFERFEPREK